MSTLEIDSFFPRFNIKTRNPSFSYPENPLISHSDENGTVWSIGSFAQTGPVNTTSTLYINVFKPFNYSYPNIAGDTVFAGNGSPNLRISFSGTTTIYNTSTSVSTTTGALQVAGGVGIGGDVWMGKVLKLTVSTSDPFAGGPYGSDAGHFAVADGVSWDPASKSGTVPYPVFYNGVTWNALY
jgi:hypothetical protein